LFPGKYSRVDAKSERINVPGTAATSNWSYRLLTDVKTLIEEKEVLEKVNEILPTESEEL